MLILQQRSALSGFTHDVLTADGTVIGELRFPDWAQARNARLKNPAPGLLRSSIDLTLLGTAYRIEFEYTRRGWENDFRYELMRADTCVATVDVNARKGWFRPPTIEVKGPCTGQLVRRFGRLKTRFDWVQGGRITGRIEELDLIAVQRRLGTFLPQDVPPELQCLLMFLVLVIAYG